MTWSLAAVIAAPYFAVWIMTVRYISRVEDEAILRSRRLEMQIQAMRKERREEAK